MIEGFNSFIAFIARNVKKIIGMAVIVAIIAIVFTMAFRTGYSFMRADSYTEENTSGKMVTIEIPGGITVEEIGEMLVEKGVLDSTFEFRLKARLQGASDFKYGVYYIREGDSVDDIIAILKAGDQSDVVTVNVTPGMTIDELAQELETLDVCQMVYFKKACNSTSYDMKELREIDTLNRRYALEGYLLPGSYQIIKDSGSSSVVKVFLDELNASMTKAMRQKIEDSPYSLDQILTIASLVQAECKVASDYPIFASMILNRLKSRNEELHYLNLPSSILYAQQRYDDELTTVTDLDQTFDSLFNTYLHENLPPGPICNPSIEAIKAVLYPEDTQYIYYEIDLSNRNGARHFSTSLGEHEAFLESQR